MTTAVLRLFCFGVLLVLGSFCHKELVIEPDGPIAPSTLLQRAKHQFEVHKSPRGPLKWSPQWSRAYTVVFSTRQALVVPVHYLASDVTAKSALAVHAVIYLLIYTGDDRQLRFEMVSDDTGHLALDTGYREI
jgi:hypothetical protein